jgi:hypothetical protein
MSVATMEKQKGLLYSTLLHAFWLLIAVVGLPNFFTRPPEEPTAISIELLPITGITNIKPSDTPPTPAPKPDTKPSAEKPKPSAPVKTADTTPPPPKAADKPLDKKADEKKPDAKKQDKKTKPEDLAAVLKAVRDTAQEQNKKPVDSKAASDAHSKSSQFDPSLMISMSEKDAIRSQFAKCWNVPAGAKDAQNLRVVLHITLAQDGTVITVELGDESKDRYASDGFFRAAADSAIRAVRQCSPLQSLPPDKYDGWHEMELTFDPKEMLF